MPLATIRNIATLALVVISLLGCAQSAERRVRSTFQIPIYKSLSEENIRASVIEKIPLGSSEDEIYLKLKQLGLGSDGLSSVYPADKKGEIVARIEFDPNELGLVKKHYGIILQLDEKHTLKDVVVHEWLTGL